MTQGGPFFFLCTVSEPLKMLTQPVPFDFDPRSASNVNPDERRRRPPLFPRRKGNLEPTVRPVTVNGEHVLAVSLSGGRGENLDMYIAPEVWAWVREVAGPCWVVNYNGTSAAYVCSTAKRAGRLAGQKASSPKLNLARLIASRAQDIDGLAVTYRNHIRRDLRMTNLRIVPRGDVLRTFPDAPPPVVLEGHV
jgi:hypothetical protein